MKSHYMLEDPKALITFAFGSYMSQREVKRLKIS